MQYKTVADQPIASPNAFRSGRNTPSNLASALEAKAQATTMPVEVVTPKAQGPSLEDLKRCAEELDARERALRLREQEVDADWQKAQEYYDQLNSGQQNIDRLAAELAEKEAAFEKRQRSLNGHGASHTTVHATHVHNQSTTVNVDVEALRAQILHLQKEHTSEVEALKSQLSANDDELRNLREIARLIDQVRVDPKAKQKQADELQELRAALAAEKEQAATTKRQFAEQVQAHGRAEAGLRAEIDKTRKLNAQMIKSLKMYQTINGTQIINKDVEEIKARLAELDRLKATAGDRETNLAAREQALAARNAEFEALKRFKAAHEAKQGDRETAEATLARLQAQLKQEEEKARKAVEDLAASQRLVADERLAKDAALAAKETAEREKAAALESVAKLESTLSATEAEIAALRAAQLDIHFIELVRAIYPPVQTKAKAGQAASPPRQGIDALLSEITGRDTLATVGGARARYPRYLVVTELWNAYQYVQAHGGEQIFREGDDAKLAAYLELCTKSLWAITDPSVDTRQTIFELTDYNYPGVFVGVSKSAADSYQAAIDSSRHLHVKGKHKETIYEFRKRVLHGLKAEAKVLKSGGWYQDKSRVGGAGISEAQVVRALCVDYMFAQLRISQRSGGAASADVHGNGHAPGRLAQRLREEVATANGGDPNAS